MDNPEFNFHIVSDEGGVTIREGKAPDIFVYSGFRYKTDSTDSFCRLLKAKAADISSAVVFAHDSGFMSIVDTTVKDRPQDTVSYGFQWSTACKEWADIFTTGKAFTVREMVDFLKRRMPGEIDNMEEFLCAAQNFRYVIKTEGDFTRDDSHNYVAAIKVGTAEGTIKIPEKIYVSMELFNESAFVQEIEVEVEIHYPKDEKDGRPGFFLSCPKFDRYIEKAKINEFINLSKELEGFLIVKGACA
jgi:hypothetical protein